MGISSQLKAEPIQAATPGPQQSWNAPGAAQQQQQQQTHYPAVMYPSVNAAPVNQNAQYPVISHGQGLPQGQATQSVPQGFPQGGPQGPPQGGIPVAPSRQTQDFFSIVAIQNKLQQLVQENGLHAFYSSNRVAEVARSIGQHDFAKLAERWRLPAQMALDLVGLALYDTVIMVDDSASMRFAEGGERIQDMKTILERISSVCGLLDTDGISLHTMNGNFQRDNVRYSQEAAEFVRQIQFEGATPLGTMIHRKLLDPYVYQPASRRNLRKPVHIVVITDGEPTGESSSQVRTSIARCKDFLKGTPYGAGGVAFQFAQVGLDERAQNFLAKLDNDSKVGKMVDCTSAYELEQEEYRRRSGIFLTPDMYLNKLCLGAIDRSYDEQDEDGAAKKKSFLKRLFT